MTSQIRFAIDIARLKGMVELSRFPAHRHQEILQPHLQGSAIGGVEPAVETIEYLLAVAPIIDHVAHAQKPQVMRHRRLRKAQLLAEAGDVLFAAGQRKEDVQPRPVRQKSEQTGQLFEVLFGGPRGCVQH